MLDISYERASCFFGFCQDLQIEVDSVADSKGLGEGCEIYSTIVPQLPPAENVESAITDWAWADRGLPGVCMSTIHPKQAAYCAVLPPVRNARMATVKTAGVKQVKGFVALVEQSEFVGVVCKTPSAVDAAMAKIQVAWDLQQPINQQEIDLMVDVDAAMAEGDLEHVLVDEAHRPDANWGIDLRFDVQELGVDDFFGCL